MDIGQNCQKDELLPPKNHVIMWVIDMPNLSKALLIFLQLESYKFVCDSYKYRYKRAGVWV